MTEEFLTRLIYASTVTEAYSNMELGNILEACKRNNAPLNVTGLLFIGNNYFFQCLEGSRENVNFLYQKLLFDERHQNVQILETKEVGSRYFDDWSMKYVPSINVVKRIMRETGMKQFNPYELDNYTANAMLEAFRDCQEVEDSKTANNVVSVKRTKSFHLSGLFKRHKQLAY